MSVPDETLARRADDTGEAGTGGVGALLRRLVRRTGQAVNTALRPVLGRLPRGLFARSLLIVLVPILILQAVMTFVFMDRHWELVTRRLSDAVVRDVALVIELIDEAEDQTARNAAIRSVARHLEMFVDVLPGERLPSPVEHRPIDILYTTLSEQLASKLARPYWIDARGSGKFIDVRVALPDGVLRATIRRSHAYASNSHIFLVWMTAASAVLILLAVLFLRNQIRPIVALSQAAERFGRGLDAPGLRPRGATEVRRAAIAFQQMRTRMQRFVEQRTVMLAGVSHDLRTVLTRFRLQLALLDDTPEVGELKRDVDEMEAMLEGYLSFVKGGGGEVAEETDVADLVRDAARMGGTCQGGTCQVETRHQGPRHAVVRPQNMRRLVANLVANACRYGQTVLVVTEREDATLTLTVDDDGPGIPEGQREEALRPFNRLDGARQQTGAHVGLGLAIAHDIARAHGGSLVLEDAPLGGLRARVALPV